MYKFIAIFILLIILFFMIRRMIHALKDQEQPGPALLKKAQMLQDPVCKMYVTADTAVIENMGGQTYYFCSPKCAQSFKKHLAS